MWLDPVIKEIIPSTNSYLKENCLFHGSVVIAKRQTHGRGRRGNSWLSDVEGNIYMSVAYVPNLPCEKIPLLSLAVGLAVHSTLEGFGIECGLKWPNDVIANGKKICGIMSELVDGICVTGIGINLKKLPENCGLSYATSAEELGFSLNKNDVIEKLLQNIEYEITHTDDIIERYSRHCLTLGKEVLINNTDKATALEISKNGSLVVDLNGERIAVNCGDVSIRGTYGYI